MSVNLSAIGNGINFLNSVGEPLDNGLLYTYQAGSSTPLATYTDNSGLIPNTNPIVLRTDGRLPSELWLTAGYTYKFVLEDSNNNLIATYDNIYGILGTIPTGTSSSVPTGVIMMWSGSIGSIPEGFFLCDGTNGTPDLRNRFIIGAGNIYSVAQTGGSKDAIVVSHTHTAVSTSTITDPGHTHALQNLGSAQAGPDVGGAPVSAVTGWYTDRQPSPTVSATTGITVSTSTTNNTSGTSGTNANLPPYYALCYIMKS